MSTEGHKVLARMSLCGHQVPNKDFPIEDVLDRDVPFEDMSVEDNPVEDLMSTQGHDVLGWMSLWGHHVLAVDVPADDVLGCFHDVSSWKAGPGSCLPAWLLGYFVRACTENIASQCNIKETVLIVYC